MRCQELSKEDEDEIEEIAWRCIMDSSEVHIVAGKGIKFVYTDYEQLQNLIIKAIEEAR